MRILHVIPYYQPAIRYGGPITSVHGLCRALAKKGHEVSVFTTSVDGEGDSVVRTNFPIIIDGVRVTYFKSTLFRRLFVSMSMLKALRKKINEVDILHNHTTYSWPTLVSAKLARNQRVPYVMSPRGMLVESLIARKSPFAKKAWIRVFEKKNAECAAAIHVTSSVEEIELERFGWRLPKIAKIINGVSDPNSAVQSRISQDVIDACEDGVIVLYLGRISWKKGLDLLLRSFAKSGAGTLVIAGTDDEKLAGKMSIIANELGIAHRVRIIPRTVSGDDKEFLFKRSSLFVLTSLNENFGNTILEAMRRGVPVVVAKEVGASEIVRRSSAGIVVEASEIEISCAINRLLADPSLRNDMGAAGLSYALRQCTWPAVAAEMEELYIELQRNSKSHAAENVSK